MSPKLSERIDGIETAKFAGLHDAVVCGVIELELDNEALTKRVAELEAQVLMLDKHVEYWAERATVADLKLTQSERRATDLQSKLAWTPVAQGLPTEHADYEFTYCDSEQVSRLDLVGLTHEGFVLVLSGDTFAPDELLDNVDYTHFRRITLPEAT